LEAEGYEIQSVVIPACAKNAPHKRDRIWIIGKLVANTKRLGWEKRAEKSEEFNREKSSDNSDNGSQGCTISNTDKDVGNTKRKSINTNSYRSQTSSSRSVEQRVGNLADGISKGLLRHFDREPGNIPRVTTGEKDRAKKLKALGNSIVPQVAAEILLAIRISEESV
jgi:DNA (cytosine-5)-methyltransferase 1